MSFELQSELLMSVTTFGVESSRLSTHCKGDGSQSPHFCRKERDEVGHPSTSAHLEFADGDSGSLSLNRTKSTYKEKT